MSPLSALLFLAYGTALGSGITIVPGGQPKPYQGPSGVSNVILSSLNGVTLDSASGILPSGDSFIRGAIQAWGEHLHLVIRPEEIWFTILVQMNFYMNSHAEQLRDVFVNHQGQEVIYVEDVTWEGVLSHFDEEIQARVKTPWLLDWIRPGFTTTTKNDLMTANILMMGLTKAYFRFEGGIICGLPSVTLLGSQEDWEALLAKLDHLPDFGTDPAAYKTRLRPILSRMVNSFKEPDSPATRQFWNQIVSASQSHICGAPPFYVSGWITGFYFWDTEGNPWARGQGDLTLDGVTYPALDLTHNVPVGYARAPFIMRDFNNTERYEAYVAGGTMGKQITQGPPDGYKAALERAGGQVITYNNSAQSTLKPLSSWMLYGPVSYNTTETNWLAETEELTSLMSSIRKYFIELFTQAQGLCLYGFKTMRRESFDR
ncbi:hypothetical protein GQ53DRAFT_801383 [Thozetella sp. PMI_491]|nr:hypothetical protein GQ53DRAFT_801383 [Thozetella sp. PMI_491]